MSEDQRKALSVELSDAFAWFCDRCSRENFVRPVPCGTERHNGKRYECRAIPDRVKCVECHAEFDTYWDNSE